MPRSTSVNPPVLVTSYKAMMGDREIQPFDLLSDEQTLFMYCINWGAPCLMELSTDGSVRHTFLFGSDHFKHFSAQLGLRVTAQEEMCL